MSLVVPGLYERVRSAELRLALSPDPRLLLGDLPPHERATLESQKYSPTVLYQVEELLDHQPVRLPRWLLGGRVTCPEAKDWPAYQDQRHQSFWLSPDDTLMPAE
jgi:hypothetical protein